MNGFCVAICQSFVSNMSEGGSKGEITISRKMIKQRAIEAVTSL